ncbi:MAG TPA: HNH endonuclease signature motif containing protein [Umezawaea sp.]|nr:HNH endonuclease signature motif containing protein [Umezawaea sp.]
MGAWSLLSFGEKRDFQGNTGYADVLESQYLYDSTVQNSGILDIGDLVVVRDKKAALGVGWVQGIAAEPGVTKIRKMCPACKRTGFKLRTTVKPPFLCQRCDHAFTEPDEKPIVVTSYVADYAGTWRPLDGVITAESLNGIALNASKQQSIRPIDRAAAEKMLGTLHVPLAPRSDLPRQKVDGGRRSAMGMVRIGQDAFRRGLLQKYGFVCAVTGPCPAEALDAAHLRAFAAHGIHDLDEGLLFRVDIHRLFDRGLVAVHPRTLEVHFAPQLQAYAAYEALHGSKLRVASPGRQALADHYEVATASWA